MTSHLVLEGVLDVKDPRGSEDRKFWKAWRRLWIRFSVVYPLGRREPYLLLHFSRSSSEVPEKEIEIPRDGLRLFRCRSTSRPYRTWAMASGNKVVLYFAAESEIQGQHCMQSVRDGLWPPCFSFQMLTAYSQEVSLIDDDRTFMSGLLGVYGRFVLTSEDVISLMHPYWGSALLQISLDNIKDVVFVREAEVPPAGVFSIVLKRVESSKVKALQFFCHTARETMQWILNILHGKIFKECIDASENKTSTRKNTIPTNNSTQMHCDNKNTDVLNVSPSSIQVTAQTEDKIVDIDSGYEHLQHLKTNPLLKTYESLRINDKNAYNSDEYGKLNKRTSEDNTSGQNLVQQSIANDSFTITKRSVENKSSNGNTYANVVSATDYATVKSLSFSKANSGSEYENIKLVREKATSSPAVLSSDRPESVTNSILNKNSKRNSNHKTLKTLFSTNQPSANETCINKNLPVINTLDYAESSKNSSKTNCEISSIVGNETSNGFIDNSNKHGLIESSKDSSISKENNKEFHPNYRLYSTVNKSIRKDSNEPIQNVQLSLKDALNEYRNTTMDNSRLLPNLPSDFLDTSINSAWLEDKKSRGSSSSEDDTDILAWLAGEVSGLNSTERLYEDIIDRKGTVYEEIDASDDENQPYLPPELPRRPENLEIPDSLRLQKLSKSITQTLKVMENTEAVTKEFPRTKFIKKIRDANRITQLNTSQEHAREHFAIESKLPVNNTNMLSVGTTVVNSSVNTKS